MVTSVHGRQQIARLWNTYMRVYDRLGRSVEYRRMQASVKLALELPSRGLCVDLGCGTGYSTLNLVGENRSVVAVDTSPEALVHARAKAPKVDFRQQDALEFLQGTQNATVDRVLAVNVLYAMHDGEELLRQIYRVLRPGGLFVFADPIPSMDPKRVLFANYRWRWKENNFAKAFALIVADTWLAARILMINREILKLVGTGSYPFSSS